MSTESDIVWLLLDSKGFGGIETHVLELAIGLKKNHINTRVVFLSDYGQHPLQLKFNEYGITYSKVEGIIELIKLRFDKKPKIIHTHGYKAGLVGRMAGRFSKVKIVSTFHSGFRGKGRVALYDWLDRASSFFSAANICVSEEIAKALPQKAEVHNNFVSIPDGEFSKGKAIAFVGRLSWEKGADRIIQIAKELPGDPIYVYGDGDYINALRKSGASNIVLMGGQREMSNEWQHIGLLVLPSRAEGLPMVAIEAMARGIPVVANDVGDIKKLVKNMRNGWLIRNYSCSNFCQRIKQWKKLRPVERSLISNNAFSTVKNDYSPEACIPKIIAAYNNCAPMAHIGS